MHVDVIADFESLVRLRRNWDAVYDADPEAQIFLSWTWVANWFRGLDCPWVILAAKPSEAASAYVAFFPLQFRIEQDGNGDFYNEIKLGGASLAGYMGFICTPPFQNGALQAFAHRIRKFNWTTLKLDAFHASEQRLRLFLDGFDDPEFTTTKAFRRVKGDDTDYEIYPYIDLPDAWETYLNGNLGGATRSNARSWLRKLDAGEFRITHANEETLERDLETLMGFWEIKWKPSKGDESARAESRNHRNMLSACFKDGIVLILVLWSGDRPIGAQGTLIDRHNRSLVCLVGSRDLTVKKPSPNFILHLHSIRWAIEQRFSTYDLQLGNHRYKYDFGPKERRVECVWVGTRSNRNLREQLEPLSLPALFARASRLFQTGEVAQAALCLRNLLDSDPRHTEAQDLLARAVAAGGASVQDEFAKAHGLHQQGHLEEAGKRYRAILAVAPSHFDAAHLLGVTFLQRNQFEMAERQIGKAIAIKPGIAAAHSNRGNALGALHRFDEALECYGKAIALNAGYAEAYNNRGTVLVDLKRFDDALADFDKALSLRPDYSQASRNRDNMLRERRLDADAGHQRPQKSSP